MADEDDSEAIDDRDDGFYRGGRRPGVPTGLPRFGGRAKGTPNRVTVEAKMAARAIVDDPDYREALKARVMKGTVQPAIETMLWYYAHGKPRETIALTGAVELLSRRELEISFLDMTPEVHEQVLAELEASQAELDRRLASLVGETPEVVDGQTLSPVENPGKGEGDENP